MAGYREHISVSGLLGLFYGSAMVIAFGVSPIQGGLAAALTWVAGMIPDLDSESGKPIRELFGLTAAIAPLVLMQHVHSMGGNTERAMLLAFIVYVLVRFGGASLVGMLSVHRGMFHSIPALLISAQVTFLFYANPSKMVKLTMALGVAIGFLSHLVLDEMYSIQWDGTKIKLARSAGSALKFVGKRFWPNAFCYGLLMFFTFAILVNIGATTLPGEDSPPVEYREAREIEQLEDAPLFL